MLTMTEIDDIREAYYVKGKTISTIAKDYGKDRKTVRKYIQQEDFNVARPTDHRRMAQIGPSHAAETAPYRQAGLQQAVGHA